jgi:TonB family protein
MVILEALVTPTGCIGSARVLKGVHPGLDANAMRTALQWTFAPTLLGGTPVPVIMSITVDSILG